MAAEEAGAGAAASCPLGEQRSKIGRPERRRGRGLGGGWAKRAAGRTVTGDRLGCPPRPAGPRSPGTPAGSDGGPLPRGASERRPSRKRILL